MNTRGQQLIDLAESLLLRYGRSIEFLTVVENGGNITEEEARWVHDYVLDLVEEGSRCEFDCE